MREVIINDFHTLLKVNELVIIVWLSLVNFALWRRSIAFFGVGHLGHVLASFDHYWFSVFGLVNNLF